jgi:hypothetical protein
MKLPDARARIGQALMQFATHLVAHPAPPDRRDRLTGLLYATAALLSHVAEAVPSLIYPDPAEVIRGPWPDPCAGVPDAEPAPAAPDPSPEDTDP